MCSFSWWGGNHSEKCTNRNSKEKNIFFILTIPDADEVVEQLECSCINRENAILEIKFNKSHKSANHTLRHLLRKVEKNLYLYKNFSSTHLILSLVF